MQPAVYILASKRNGTLYIGVTSDLIKRIWEHKNDLVEGFTKQYHVHILVWYELHERMESAITREKRLKDWKRAWELALIEKSNPDWQDLYEKLFRLDSGLRRNDGQKAREEMEWVEFKHKKTPIDAGLIRLHSGTRRDACYVPFWA